MENDIDGEFVKPSTHQIAEVSFVLFSQKLSVIFLLTFFMTVHSVCIQIYSAS